mmetsp:Transcript_3611/g.5600  ORF Transcript_3611/g.5600 Transcript_3611/m.5600 type:complete len:449 (+) Transcript_3611:80-1426(+)
MIRRWGFTGLAVIALLALSRGDDFEDYAGAGGDMDYGYGEGGYGGDPYGGYGGGGYGGGYGMDPYGGGYGGDPYGGYGGGPPPIPMKEFTSIEEIKEFVAEDDKEPAIVGYFDLETHSADKEAFDEAHQMGQTKYRFGFTSSKEVLEAMKYDGCSVVVYRPSKFVSEKYEKPKSRYPSKSIKSSSALMKFIEDKSLPLVGLKTAAGASRYEDQGLPEVTLFVEVDLDRNFKQFQYYANRLRKVAKDYTSKVVFNIGDKEEQSYLASSKYGITLPDRKDVGLGLRSGGNFYKMETSFSMDNVRAFVEEFLAGGLAGKEHQQADDLDAYGEEEEDGPSAVVTLDNSNFDEVVTESGNDVMVEFYAPWCGHCKALKPTYASVANRLSDVETVTVAAMDASTHTPPSSFDVQGFPTLYFVPGDKSKSPMPYEGPRDADAIVDFIKKHATTKF